MPWEEAHLSVQQGVIKSQPTVVLLHGLWRSKNAMRKLETTLVADGYRVVNVGYPSNRKNLANLSQHVEQQIAKHVDPGSKVHFVTHSLGGIVVRQLLNQSSQWEVQRVVMLAPPNHGSEIVAMLDKAKLAWLLGPVHKDLLSLSNDQLPATLPKQIELGIIMGTDSGLRIFNPLLPGQSDGVVTVEGGKMPGMQDFKTTANNHTFIMLDNEVVEATRHFLKSGAFAQQPDYAK